MFLTDLLNLKAEMLILQNRPTLLNLILLLLYLVMLILWLYTVLLFYGFEEKSMCIDCSHDPKVNLDHQYQKLISYLFLRYC